MYFRQLAKFPLVDRPFDDFFQYVSVTSIHFSYFCKLSKFPFVDRPFDDFFSVCNFSSLSVELHTSLKDTDELRFTVDF